MDSGNSGSMSSSEGDDHDLDVASRPQSISGFLNSSLSNASMQLGSSSDVNNNNPNLFFQYQQNHPNSNPFDLSSNYLRNASPQPHPPNLSSLLLNNQSSNLDPNSTTNTRSNHQQQQLPSSSSAHIKPSNNLGRNSKKRTRASRRAPTTVLTTDTSNFRAMVQEFTGIPAPPFASGSSSSYSRRLDSIFGSSGSVYPLRPSAQKVHQYAPFLSSSNSSSSFLMSNSVGMIRASSSTSNTSHHDMSNFDFNTQQGLIGKQLPNHYNIMGNMQNPSFNASHSYLLHQHEQQLPPFLSSSSISFGAKPNRDSTHSSHGATLPLHSLDDRLGMRMSSHGYQSTNLDGSTMLPLRSDGDHDIRWRDHHGLGLGALSDGRGVVDQSDQLRPRLGDQGLENSSRSNTSRGIEATVDSWVFPSDYTCS